MMLDTERVFIYDLVFGLGFEKKKKKDQNKEKKTQKRNKVSAKVVYVKNKNHSEQFKPHKNADVFLEIFK